MTLSQLDNHSATTIWKGPATKMCGIAGCTVQGLNQSEVATLADAFIASLKHRGPDGHGHWSAPDTFLLTHTRLSIQDLSEAGKQPMHSASQRYVISFNGEIYNFPQIRKELQQQGVAFKGHSDTEVILALVDSIGIAATLERIDGMFAIALFDQQSGNLTLARDRMGEKPLFYGWVGEQFVFGSELKAFHALGKKLTLNKEIIGDFLACGYIPTPYSIFQNIYKLAPGTYLTLSQFDQTKQPRQFSPHPGTVSGPVRYWNLRDISLSGPDLTTDSRAIGNLQDCLMETIGQQLVADVPVGCFLSGGIDSTLVTALAQAGSATPIDTFTIGFDDPQFDEAQHASELARHIGTNHHETYISSNDALGVIDALPTIYDEPFADPSQLPSVLVSAIAKQSVTVCLSGDGGDELFAGYNRYSSTSRMLEKTKWIPKPLRERLGKMLCRIKPGWIEQLLPYVSRIPGLTAAKQANVALKIRKLGWLMQTTKPEDIYLFLLSFNGLEPDPERCPDILKKRVLDAFQDHRDFLDTVMLLDQLNYLVDDNLTKVDRSSMSVSLETRLPLLDRKVVEMSWRIAPSLKLNDDQTKWPLRQILYQHVPRDLIERPKMGFSVPIRKWLREELQTWGSMLINTVPDHQLISESFYKSLWETHLSGRADNSLQLWPALILLQWLQQHKNTILID
ncbi:asparagine synthase (glutamine-hydrolyzing) [Marinobacter maroccanus]|uniref:asparagine synthase (glutamine-hydrolyzing) n=1 Tax=Marinobacter maroccanus TaxID=2055143 RepID=A0A2S5ZBW3_9GAMM|nr:asparagine synthase (glutamine-hydrolyzing) [Marinobacter maroccanus]PPI84714.1 asparagine synthase (glutamine-hydrolyzing) [Marinobacter maroccanus]